MKEIVIASSNKGKIKEIQEILSNYKIISLKELNINLDIEIEENGKTFLENAIKKATEIAKILDGKTCIADDSGIEIEYLNGFPGVHTKRWMEGTDRQRNLAILDKLQGVPKDKRKITFTTAIALTNGKDLITAEGKIIGYVSEEIRGENGFGFDEIFELENGKTLAELSNNEKNQISSRKKALEILKEKLKQKENL